MFSTRKALGLARQEAALNRVRVQELEEALADLLVGVDALPMSIPMILDAQARRNVRDGHGFAIKYPALTNPLFLSRVERARRTLGVR